MKNFKLKLLAGILGLSILGMAQAETASANIDISTNVTAFCSITMPDLTFPQFSSNDPSSYVKGISGGIGYRTGATGMLNIGCSKGTSYAISSNHGIYGIEGTSDGRLSHTINSDVKITYKFQVWSKSDPNTTITLTPKANETLASGIGTGVDDMQLVEIRTLIGVQNATDKRAIAGTYTDTITLTVTY